VPTPVTIAYFITPHGFGHASRAAAVMAALQDGLPQVRFELFTTCPEWIFSDSLRSAFGYHAVQPEIGMVQISPLEADLKATCDALDQRLPFDARQIAQLALQLRALDCRLVICDIAALGIAVARRAGIPSVLVENFTWDWIYQAFESAAGRLKSHIAYLQHIYGQADHRIQCQPLCRAVAGALRVGPVSRRPRATPEQIRRTLGIPGNDPMVLITMGGVADGFDFMKHLPPELPFFLVIPGAQGLGTRHERVIALPTHSDLFHPDLVLAADLLIGKAGYSTIAEVYHAGTPFGIVRRSHFPESAVLTDFATRHLSCRPISARDYASGRWLQQIPELLTLPRTQPRQENGAREAARFILRKLNLTTFDADR